MLVADDAAAVALSGDDRALARIADPELLACRTAGDVTAYYARAGAGSEDPLIAGIVLTWSGDAPGAYALLRQAHDRAVSEGRYAFAVAALERLAHEALLFGDVDTARTAADDGVRLAAAHSLAPWLLRCLIVAARLALDAGDLASGAHLLERAVAQTRPPGMLAACAAIGAQLALEKGDASALAIWTGPDIVAAALRSDDPELARAATTALLTAAESIKNHLQVRLALRRALLGTGNPSHSPELFSMAARYGDLDEARLASRALAAVPAANRRYLRAHRLLARAYLAFRFGGRTAWADHASDAARAFNAMGLRRWTNEAMLLLVRQPGGGGRHPGQGRPPNSMLTEREQQVADLIRRGARNREVALALQISEHTVERHVSSILGRLGLRSRWQIADTRKKNED
ncbi:MAG TPA: helix-turn-helix transcriptional regulator [Candidatus Binatia bacterium]|nr:helix-turn-helix transcriptional regulator [Candidatus Binatia bacterium]